MGSPDRTRKGKKAQRRLWPRMKVSQAALDQVATAFKPGQSDAPALPFGESPDFHQFQAEAANRRALIGDGGVIRVRKSD